MGSIWVVGGETQTNPPMQRLLLLVKSVLASTGKKRLVSPAVGCLYDCFFPQLCFFWTALPVFCYRIVLQEPIISAKIPQVGVPVWPANQSDCGLQWKKLNYTNHSSTTLEMGTEAFLEQRRLTCEPSPRCSRAACVQISYQVAFHSK